MPPLLDVAIGTVFVFLLFSLVVTAANELLLSWLDKRAKFLEEGLAEMLSDVTLASPPSSLSPITVADLLGHGLISSLSRGQYNPNDKKSVGVPSYIPGKSFVLALLALVQSKAGIAPPPAAGLASPPASGATPPKTLEGLQLADLLAAKDAAMDAMSHLGDCIDMLPDCKLRTSLAALFHDAQGDLEHFKANIENWYDESMARVGGWYKRYAQQWLLVLGFIGAAACNVNTVRIVRQLSIDPKLRDTFVSEAVDYAKDPKNAPPAPGQSSSSKDLEDKAITNAAQSPEIAKFQAALGAMHSNGIPMGWGIQERQAFFDADGHWLVLQVLTALIGWLITALAASLGAPFWFDILNRFVDIRGVGRAPEEKDPTAPKKKPGTAESYVEPGNANPTA